MIIIFDFGQKTIIILILLAIMNFGSDKSAFRQFISTSPGLMSPSIGSPERFQSPNLSPRIVDPDPFFYNWEDHYVPAYPPAA